MMKKINLVVFKDNKTKDVLRGLAFMECPYCKKDVLLDIDKISFCDFTCRKINRFAYKLNKDLKSEEGFDKVFYIKTDTFNKKKLMEEFKK